MSDQSTFFTKNYGGEFGQYSDADDLLHPGLADQVTDYGATETQYLGFNIPEAGITCINYLWHHPKLRAITGGSVAWQGFNQSQTQCQLTDMRCFMDDSPIANDLHEYQLDTGYRARIIEPMRKFHIQYDDPSRNNHFDVTLTAIAPPAMTASGRHFEQAMKSQGRLTLRGETFTVDGYMMRDRTWGESRSEAPMPIPHTTWMNGIFGDDFAFNINAIDHPDLDPIWKPHFSVPAEHVLMGGWIWRDGELRRVVEARKRLDYDPATLIPKAVEMRLKDSTGQEYELHGTVINATTLNFWMNMRGPAFLTRWDCDGRTGYGDSQDVQWTDFVNCCLPSRSAV